MPADIGSERKRVAFLTSGLTIGGAETQMVRVSRALKRRGWAVEVISMITPAMFLDDLAADDIPVASLDMVQGKASLGAAVKCVKILRRFRPQALVTFNFPADVLGRFAAKASGIPTVVSSVGSSRQKNKRRVWMYRLTDSLMAMTAPNSDCGAAMLENGRMIKRSKMRIMRNAFDFEALLTRQKSPAHAIRAELDVPDDGFMWLAVGNVLDVKDYPNMLRAVKLVRDELGPVFRLRVAGEPRPSLDPINALAAELGVSDVVKFLGKRSDVLDLMSVADGYVLSSQSEGMPNAIVEAMASSLPIVATDVGDVATTVKQGVSGYVVPPKDSEALGKAMLHLMALSVQDRKRMGEVGRADALARHEAERVVDGWEELLVELIAKKPRRG